ncbi:M15 family metallopeptidase [Solibacillus sp. FSL H8-0538]|uniref:M15 family metallopeptidase n=1 Tax=Solibacillus sp. FSL H8-0538 TaxID=2921400 RepID=UPI0030FAD6D7
MGKLKTSHKRSNNKILIGAFISFVLLISIVASIFYKNEMAKTSLAHQQEEQVTEVDAQPEPEPEPQPEPQPNQDKSAEEVEQGEAPTTEQPKDSIPKEQEIENGYIDGQAAPTEPTFIDGVLVVNKKTPLPKTYNKGEDPKARAAFEKMAAAARIEGFELVAFSGFRSYEYQQQLYTNYVNRDGKVNADRYSARPGYSEHQTGLAFDIGEKGKEDLWLTSEFGETKAGQWLIGNAHQYGFILRYPKGKENVTGFMYESWHFRYLGKELATKVFQAGVSLEEYLNID